MAGLQTLNRLTPIPCGRCGRTLIDQDSIARGYGPECAHLIAVEQAEAQRFPIQSRVRAEGNTGTVVGYRSDVPKPFRVSFRGYAASFRADELEPIGGAA
jgi:hypothetical protein